MKKLLSLIAIFGLSIQFCSGAWASNSAIKSAIRKYKTGNYTGCLQYCQNIVKQDPSNAVAYYYMAMSYVQAGRKNEAILCYSRVLSLKPNVRLSQYAATGKRCLESPDKCRLTPTKGETTDIDKFIASPPPDGIAPSVKKDIEAKQLQGIQHKINDGKQLNTYEIRNFNNRSEAETKDKTATAEHKPTNDEIVAAIKVLNDAGLNSYAQQAQAVLQSQALGATANPYAKAASYQTPDETQINMLMNNGNLSQNNNNAMVNMLPYMLAQSKNGQTNYSPQLMQSVIMNSMMTDFNFGDKSDKN